ncbi:MAG: nucleotidyltransferase domain-containing protein [Elusimicrobiota bacterium]
MRMHELNKVLLSSNKLKVLNYLILYADRKFYESEISKNLNISNGSVNAILNEFVESGLLKREQSGPLKIVSVLMDDKFLKEYRAFINMLALQPLVEDLKKDAIKVVLFGSFARGENTQKSDIDLYILTYKKKGVMEIINKYSETEKVLKHRIQSIIENPLKKSGDKVFIRQVEMGKVLWEREVNEEYEDEL